MADGYAGKILIADLSKRETTVVETAKYAEFIGGVGIGAALFWDLAVAPGDWDLLDPFNPRNVVSLMTGPTAATGVPGGGRTSICGIGPETYPTALFHRTSMGGRFGNMLKQAGWDGIAVQGRADGPVWINIINDKVTIEDARQLWGMNTHEAQGRIMSIVEGNNRFGEEWLKIEDDYTTARPQIVCIGPVGEAASNVASLIHGNGVSARTGGFGGVFGSKNLKAISVIGTGSVKPANPKEMVAARLAHMGGSARMGSAGAASCMPCLNSDRKRNSFYGGESMCADEYWSREHGMRAADVAMRWGICTWATKFGGALDMDVPGAPALFNGRVPMEPGVGWYIKYLYDLGVLGPGKQIESYPLPMEQWNTLVFREIFCEAIARKIGIGAVLGEGMLHAAEKWGRLEEDMNSGAIRLPAWGASWHHTLPGVEWAYAYILGSGDPMWHGFMTVLAGGRGGFGGGGGGGNTGGNAAEALVNRIAAKMVPFSDDPLMLSNCWKGDEARKTGIYSSHKAKMVAWSRYFNELYNESMSICEMLLPNFGGVSPDLEHRYYQAATGDKRSFVELMEVGRKIWTMHRAIRVMAGRHRDQEKFAPFMHMPGATFNMSGDKPIYQNGEWSFEGQSDLYLDRDGVEEFKTHYYTLEGWDTSNGWPTRKSLEGLGLGKIADVMAAKNRLGK